MAEARAVNEEDDPLLLVLFKLQPDEGAGAAASVLALIELAGDGGEAALSSDGAGGISGSCCAMVVLLLGAHSLEVVHHPSSPNLSRTHLARGFII